MSVALDKLGNIISDLEEQAEEIGEFKNVIQRISGVEKEIEKTSEIAKQSTDKLSEILTDYTSFIGVLENKIESQHSVLKDIKSDLNNQINDFSHEFIEKVSVMRDESLSAHIDHRQDIEKVNKLISQISTQLSEHSVKNSKIQEELHHKVEIILLEQSKNLSINTKIVIFIATITAILLPLSIYFSLK